MKKFFATILVVATFLLLPGNVAHASTRYSFLIISNIVYGPNANEILDECLPVGATSARPGIVLVHGDGWRTGDKSAMSGLCTRYAALGYDVINVNYRLTSAGAMWPDEIGDVQAAVRFFRTNAVALNLDPNRICAEGSSAGSHLSLLLDMEQSIHASDVALLYPTESPSVECVVDQFGPTDLPLLYNENPHVGTTFIQPLMDGMTPTQAPALYTDGSPVDQITAQTGPVLIVQGTMDTTVLPDQSTELQTDLQNAGIPVQYISYVGGHVYKGLTAAQIAAIHAQITAYLAAFLHP